MGCVTDTRGAIHSGHVFPPSVTATPIVYGQLVKTPTHTAPCYLCSQSIAAVIVARDITQFSEHPPSVMISLLVGNCDVLR